MKTLKMICICLFLSNIILAQDKFKNLPKLSEQEFVLFLDQMLAIGCINNKTYKKIIAQKDSLPQKDETLSNNHLSSDRIFAFLAIQKEADAKEKIINLKKWIAAFEKKGLLTPKETKRMNIFLEKQKINELDLKTFWLMLADWND